MCVHFSFKSVNYLRVTVGDHSLLDYDAYQVNMGIEKIILYANPMGKFTVSVIVIWSRNKQSGKCVLLNKFL